MKHTYWISSAALLLLATMLILPQGCKEGENDPTGINVPNGTVHTSLADYNFFVGNMADLIPNDGLIPYDLNSILFTDYALKQRYVYVPEGKKAEYVADESFDFPEGTVLIKNFYYNDDFRDPTSARTILETRLLIKKAGEWDAETYVWNSGQTEATRQIAGGIRTVTWTDTAGNSQTAQYIIPNKNDCKGCHEYSEVLVPIGPKARHLNRDYNYISGTANQLDHWEAQGILTGSPGAAQAAKIPVWDDPSTGTVAERARAYLDINCGYCHSPTGAANNSALHLEYTVTNPSDWGVCKTPIAAGNGSGGRQFDILPGKPDSSILVFRMESNDLDIRMPELGRSVEHTEAVTLISQWISEMSGDCN